MYYLADDGPDSTLAPAGEPLLSGPWRAVVSEELMLVPEDVRSCLPITFRNGRLPRGPDLLNIYPS